MESIALFNQERKTRRNALVVHSTSAVDPGNKYGSIDIPSYCKMLSEVYKNPTYARNRFAKTLYEGDASYD